MTWVDNAFFAPESLVDGRGRRIMWAWVFDGRKAETRAASGWSGTMSLPRVLWLGEDKSLRMAPPEELALLRYNKEQTAIFYDSVEKKLKVDTTHSSLGEGPKSVESGPFELQAGEPLRLRAFVDKSMVEVFANDRQAVVRCTYPIRQDARGVVLFSRGGPAKVTLRQGWVMAPANPW